MNYLLWTYQLTSILVAKSRAQQKLLPKIQHHFRYFTPEQLIDLYQAQVWSYMGTAVTSGTALPHINYRPWDQFLRQAKIFINNNSLSGRASSLVHRRKMSACRFLVRHMSQSRTQLYNLFPPSSIFIRATRKFTKLHSFRTPSVHLFYIMYL